MGRRRKKAKQQKLGKTPHGGHVNEYAGLAGKKRHPARNIQKANARAKRDESRESCGHLGIQTSSGKYDYFSISASGNSFIVTSSNPDSYIKEVEGKLNSVAHSVVRTMGEVYSSVSQFEYYERPNITALKEWGAIERLIERKREEMNREQRARYRESSSFFY